MRYSLSKTVIRKLCYSLIKIRRFEEKIIELYPKQEMKTPVHLYIGQEAIAAGVCANLKREDYVFSNHRNHGHLIAKGADLKYIFAELYGRSTGCCKGKGGSMHMASVQDSIMGTSAIVSGGIPIAVGCALASKMMNEKKVAVVFFGDGAVDEGVFYESLNFASLKKLPVIFMCENNLYATNSPQKARQVNPDIYKIASFFCMPGICCNGNNVFEIYGLAKRLIDKARKGCGPSLVEARTFRWRTHVGCETDIEKGLRDREEIEQWLKRCPLDKFKHDILKKKFITEKEFDSIDKKVSSEIRLALEFALKSPYPKPSDLYEDVY